MYMTRQTFVKTKVENWDNVDILFYRWSAHSPISLHRDADSHEY